MSFVKRLEFGNYTLTFGEEKVLLDMFDEVLLPSFKNESYRRTYKEATEYFFLNTDIVKLSTCDEEPVLGIAGRIVKNTKLKREQVYKEGKIVTDKSEMESAPSSIFLLILNNHRLILAREVSGAPKIKNFESTSRHFLNLAYQNFIEREKESTKLTKKQIKSETPPPKLRITPLTDKESLDHFINKFDIIKILNIKLLPTNDERIDNSDFWQSLSNGRERMGKDSTANIKFINNKFGLEPDCVLKETGKATALGNSMVDIKGVGKNGESLKGNNDKFSLVTELDDLPAKIADAASKMYDVFNSLAEKGNINTPRIDDTVKAKIKKIFEWLK